MRGPSMTPYLNEEYATSHLKSDMVLVNMFSPAKDLKRGMVVTFRWVLFYFYLPGPSCSSRRGVLGAIETLANKLVYV